MKIPRKINFEWKVLSAFFMAVLILIVLGYYSIKNGREYVRTTAAVVHTNNVLYNTEQLLVAALDLEVGQRGFELTGQYEFLEPYTRGKAAVFLHLDSIRNLTTDNAIQQGRLDTMQLLIARRLQFAEDVIVQTRAWMATQPRPDHEVFLGSLLSRRTEAKEVMDEIRRLSGRFRGEEIRLLAGRMSSNKKKVTEFNQTFGALLVFFVLVLVAVFEVGRSNLRKLRSSEEKEKVFNGLLETNIEKLRIANTELDAFCYSVSHDLRAPLRSINGYSKILLEDYHDKLDQDGKDSLGKVMNNARKMGQLIDDLLNFSQIGKTNLASVPLQMDILANETLREQLNGKESKIVFDIRSLVSAKGDPGLIKQVWTNLLSNAIKYSSKVAFPAIEIGSTREINRIVYYIKDNGVGFDMTYAHKLFGVFQRLHKSADFEGTGVGLSIINRIITRHGGQVWAEGKPNLGATFYFSLPI